MRRRTYTLIAVVLVAIGSVALVSTASAKSPPHQGGTLTLFGTISDSYSLDLGAAGPTPGDLVGWREDLTDPNGAAAGYDNVQCTYNVPANDVTITEFCLFGFHTTEGQILGEAPVTLPVTIDRGVGQGFVRGRGAFPAHVPSFKVALTGGTEIWKTIRGYLVVTPGVTSTEYQFFITT